MHCQIIEIKMMVEIGVIFMPFSNPTCHLKDMSKVTSSKPLGGHDSLISPKGELF
jgi:hypothetical protein